MAADDDLATGTVFGSGVPAGTAAPPQDPLATGTVFGAGVAPPPATTDPGFWAAPSGGWGPYLEHRLGLGVRDVATGLGLGPVANWVGLPTPQTPAEAIQSGAQTGATAVLPALAFGNVAPAVSAASPTAQAVARVLAQQPVRQAVTGAVSGASAPALAAAGAPGWMQTAAPYVTALASGAVPGASSGWASVADQSLLDAARSKYGIPIYPGQAGSGLTRYMFSATGKFPGTGAAGALRSQQDAFNTAVGSTFGAATEGGKLTPAAMAAARSANSAPFEAVANNTTVHLDQPLLDALTDTSHTASFGLTGDQAALVNKQIDSIQDIAAKNGGQIPSDWLVNTLGVKSALSRASTSGAPEVRPYFQDVRDALNDALNRYASPQDQANLAQAQQNWKNMRTVEGLVARGNGDVSPGSLSNAVAANKYQQTAYTGGGDLGELGEIGRRYLRGPPESGTTERALAVGLPSATALAAERLLQGEVGQAAGVMGTAVAPWAASMAVNPLLRMGAMGTTAPNLPAYYARALANMVTVPSSGS